MSSTDAVGNLVKNTVRIEEQDRQLREQRRRDDQEKQRNQAVSNLTGMASGRSRRETKNSNGGTR